MGLAIARGMRDGRVKVPALGDAFTFAVSGAAGIRVAAIARRDKAKSR
jgi:hypothetical protein